MNGTAFLRSALVVLVAAGWARSDDASSREEEFRARHGIGTACDTVGIARRLEQTIALPVQKLSAGVQTVRFQYLESGWPLGASAVDPERPVRLEASTPERVRNVPTRGGSDLRYGLFELGPPTPGANRFRVVLDGGPPDWSQARLVVARTDDDDMSKAVVLENLASNKAKGFATIVVLPLTYPTGQDTRVHPAALWVYADAAGERLRYYAIAHRRAIVQLPRSGTRAIAILYDHKGRGDYSAESLMLVDAGYSPAELFAGNDGEDRSWRPPQDGLTWKTRNRIGIGQSVITSHETVRLRSITPLGDTAELVVDPR